MELKPHQDHQGVVRMTTGQRIWAEGRAAGWSEGLVEGRKEGRIEGRKEGRTEGRAEGLGEGLSQGRTEEAQRMLARLLCRRFGISAEAANARVQVAMLEQMEAWVCRILDADSVDALFAEH